MVGTSKSWFSFLGIIFGTPIYSLHDIQLDRFVTVCLCLPVDC